MSNRRPMDILEEEHHYIQMVVSVLAVLAEKLEAGQSVKAGLLLDVTEFMRIFADRCHHGKEEALLFPLLGQKGVPMNGCPIKMLINEHDRGRSLVKQLVESAEAYGKDMPEAANVLLKTLRGLVELYPGHIWREDYLLFPMTNKILNEDEQNDLFQKFEAVEAEIGHGTHQRFVQFAEKLKSEM